MCPGQMLVSPKQRYLHNDKWYWQADSAVRKMKCVATNVPNCKIIRQGFGEIWHQKGESPAQNDTHTTKINLYFNNEPPKSCNPLLDWKLLSRAIQQTMSCLQQKILWLYPDQSVAQKGKKAAVLKEVDVATQPVGQIWWVRTWIKARKQENPTEHVWRNLVEIERVMVHPK